MYVRRTGRWDQSDYRRTTMTVQSSPNTPKNTLYGPDDKPLAYFYEVEPIEFGFQPPGRSATGDAARLESG